MPRMSKPWLAAALFGACCLLLIDGQARSGEKKAAGPLLSKNDSLSSDDGKDTKLENSYRKTYKVKFAEGKTYQLDMKSKDFDAVLRIEDADGKEVAFNDDAPGQNTLDSQIVYKATKGGEYTVVATSLGANETGAYALTVVEGPGGKGVPAGKSIAIKLDKAGSATEANELANGDEQKGGKFYKSYSVPMQAGKEYTFQLKSGDFDAYLVLIDPAGKVLAQNDDDPAGGTLDSRIDHKATVDGDYRVIATSLNANESGKYSFEITSKGDAVKGGKDVPAGKAIALKFDKAGSATEANELANGDEQKGGKFYKSYSVPMKSGTEYAIQLKSGDFDAYLVVLDPKGKILAQNDDDPAGGTLDSRIDYTPTADGVYTVIATSLNANESGKYSFEISSKAGAKAAGAIEAKLKNGKYDYQGNLGDGDARVGGKFSKSFKVTLAEGKTYVVDMMSQDFDTYLYLDGPDGANITEDDDGGEGLNSRISYKAAKTGVYTLRASTFGQGGSGAFTLTIGSEDDKGGKDEKEAKVPAGKGVDAKLKDDKYSYDGNLGDGDDRVGGKFSKSFKVALEEGKTYVIDYTSQAYDPYLFLDGPDGVKITEDDDGGGFPNARITYRVEKTGTYTLRASSFDNGSGAFKLTIRVGDEKEAKNSGLQKRLQGFDKATPEQRKEIASEIIKTLTDKGADMTIADARMGMSLAFLVGDDDVKFSRSTIKGLIKAISAAEDPKIAGAAKALEMNLAKLDQIGKAMEVKGTMLDGKEFDLKNFKGKVVLVDFWATWCGPCIAEIPGMLSAYDKYHGKGFEIIGISLDKNDDIVTKFIENRKLPWACINIEDSKKLASLYKVNAIPHPVLIDQEGNIVSLNARGPRLERLIERLIGDRK